MGTSARKTESKQSASSAILCQLYDQRKAHKGTYKPIEVDFLKLFPDKSGAERATHLLHPYPAKLIRNIPRFFLDCPDIAPPKSRVLDPFCGSGTVLLEARLSGHDVVGADSNPLARVITLAKLSPPSVAQAQAMLLQIVEMAPTMKEAVPDVVNIDYWFSPRVCRQLAKLRAALLEVCGDPWNSPFMWACFSSCVRRVSLADPRLSVPVRINPDRASFYGAKGDQVLQRFERLKTVNVSQVFWQITVANIRRVERTKFPKRAALPVLFNDARSIGLPDTSVDLVITSPPYVGAQKYIRSSSLCLGWLGFSPNGKLRPIESQSIGREHLAATESNGALKTGQREVDRLLVHISDRNVLRARIALQYIIEMKSAITEAHRVLRDEGRFVLVVGPNMVSGYEFDTPKYLASIAREIGMRIDLHLVDTIASRGLMTKRNKTAGTIAQESVYVLTKSDDGR